MPYVRKDSCVTEHVFNLGQIHTYSFEYFHGLPSEEAVLNSVNFGECPFSQKAFNFIGITNNLTFG